MPEQKFEYQETEDVGDKLDNTIIIGQTFTPQAKHKLTMVVLNLMRVQYPAGNLNLGIRATVDGLPTGPDLASKSIPASSVPLYAYNDIVFALDTETTLEEGTMYAWVIALPGGDANNYIRLSVKIANAYPRGAYVYNRNDEGWHTMITEDTWFQEWGIAAVIPFKISTEPFKQIKISVEPAIPGG